jgi:phosphatidylglycerophosphatase A
MIAGPTLGILGNVFGEAGVVTDFAGMWFTLATVALLTAALVVFAFKDETKPESS